MLVAQVFVPSTVSTGEIFAPAAVAGTSQTPRKSAQNLGGCTGAPAPPGNVGKIVTCLDFLTNVVNNSQKC